jgi:hypothetical protein
METHCEQYLKICQILSTSAAFRNSVMTDQQLSVKLIHNCLCVLGDSTTPHISFPPKLFLYVNLGAKVAQKLFKTLAPPLTLLGIPHFR